MKTALLLSGGVDSSVALKLLKKQGHDITAFYLKIWLEDEVFSVGDCPWEEDIKYAEQVCNDENVPLEIVPLQREYMDRIVSYTIDEIENGRTPNPDILCNKRIKFGAFLDHIDDSFDKIATGHYADIEKKNSKSYLRRNPDTVKDQTYFLSNLKQDQLKKVIFPIGKFKKSEVRELAKTMNLPNMNRKDSQGLCFLGKIKFNEFIKSNIGIKEGNIVDVDTDKILGRHNGFYYHTIGQRHGLNLSGGPWYVTNKNTKKNIVYVCNKEKFAKKYKNEFIVHNFNWIPSRPNKKDFLIKIRHGEKFYSGTLKYIDEDTAKIKLAEKDQGIAPGQFCVFYDDKYCLGSGVIKSDE